MIRRIAKNYDGTDGREYFISENDERMVFVNGERVDIGKKIEPEMENLIDNLLDSFEDGYNFLEADEAGNYYEVQENGKVKIMRKAYFS